MKNQLYQALAKIKEYWTNLSPKTQKMALYGGGAILSAAVVLVVILNVTGRQMKVLFPKLSTEETVQAYNTLQEMGVTAQINSQGELMVPSDQWGEVQLQMAGKGYPKSAPTYDLFLNSSSFTQTESERRQTIIYQTELRIRESLMQTKGIESASVILSIPEQTGYVWDDQPQESSGTVTVTMTPGVELSSQRVAAIKNLVAFSVLPQMDPDNVKVIDAATGVELLPEDSLAAVGVDVRRLEFEARVKKDIEDNIRRLLSPIYGADGVTVAAWVTLDYDKMLTEQFQVVPEDNGDGVKDHLEETYSMDGSVPMAGLVGEEQNTDTPIYANQTGDGEGDVTNYTRSIDWQNSYIKSQIEKGQAILKEASVAVVLKTADFDQQERDDVVEMVSKAVNIKPDSIAVHNYILEDSTPVALPGAGIWSDRRVVLIAVALGVVALASAILLFVLLARRRKRQRQQEQEEEAAALAREQDLQAEIEQRKKELMETAQANTKESAITNEIRQFAKDNPEITAALIRSMLKEDE